jgi:hypothetical protein
MRVLNKRTATETELRSAVYVGRPTKWGNPFVLGRDGTREEVIRRYRDWIVGTTLMNCLEELAGKDLVCWCAPLACHADVLVELVEGV